MYVGKGVSMDIKEINKLIDKVTEKGITEFEIEKDDFKLKISKKPPEVVQANGAAAPMMVQASMPQPAAAVPQEAKAEEPAEEESDNYHVIASPMVGTFYGAPSPGAKPYVSVGDRVKKGQVCCIVEAMKIMNEIQSDVDGVVRKINAENEQPVEFGEPLFSVEVG